MGATLRLLLTQSGHSLDYAIQQAGAEIQDIPCRRYLIAAKQIRGVVGPATGTAS